MRELRLYGSVRGAAGNSRPYRDKSGHKAPGSAERARFVISPTLLRLARPDIFAWI